MPQLQAGPTTDAMRPYACRLLVQPFENTGQTEADGRLARGFWSDLIVELARFPALGVVAARSSAEPGAAPADYVVTGSVGRSGGKVRVRAQLADARTGRQLWAERYDRPEAEMFVIQDEITARVANALQARIDRQALATARRRPVAGLAAYETWLRGLDLLQQGTLQADAEARKLFQRALKLDPQFARGYAGLSLSYFNEWSCNTWDRWEETQRRSYDFAESAEELDPDDPTVQVILGRIEQHRRHYDSAERHLRQALALAPNDAELIIQLATYFAFQGHRELGVQLAERALDLNPLCPAWRFPYAVVPHFAARNYARTLELLRKAPLSIMVDLPAYGAAACAHTGDAAGAARLLGDFDRQFRERITPGRRPGWEETVLWLRHVNPFRDEADMAHFIDGVQRARTLQQRPPAWSKTRPPGPRSGLFAWAIANTFRQEGPLWTICFEHQVTHLPGLKGFHDIARLLARPNEDIHCLDLAGREENTRGAPVLDVRARREYQQRIRELRLEESSAADANDPGRAARIREELENLLAEISRATGLGGRDRQMGDSAERARSAVTWRIRKAVKAIGVQHPALGRHLDNALQTGFFCRYSPEKRVEWEV
jgi:TolB-like protein